jgi:hypothetical protein
MHLIRIYNTGGKEIMKNSLFKKVMLVGIILMILIPTTSSLNYTTQKIKIKSKVNNGLVENGTVLKRNHVFPLLKGYVFIQDYKIKNIIKKIVIDLIFTGETSLDEIQEILDSYSKNVDEIYLLAEIETPESTDGNLDCYPGNFRTHYGGYNAKGSYINYRKEYYDPLYGWNLKINGENTKRNSGYFFGYNGYVRQCYDQFSPPSEFCYFILEGNAILVFHGA